ncbi:efflux RND transporter periplasmic adaptor subunit [Stieleria magnilauensis]|uniref:HlyD family secretion protein n=1 Tax=Stieleria magnilauensis TaxID=2527963 RepID=A0ABX5XM59_9BACT|nr:HlyD family secretion protein [Planctomycetes bacterium TBK1r]
MSNDPWDACAVVIATLETRLKSALDRGLFLRTAGELMEQLPAVAAVEIGCLGDSMDPPLCAVGARPSRAADLGWDAAVTDASALSIQLWLRPDSASDTTTRRAVEEALPAIGGLLVGAIARIRLDETENELDSVSQLSTRLFDDGPWSVRLHRIAIELGSSMQVDRLSLLLRCGARFELVGSSVQARFDPRADQVHQTQAIATTIDRQLDQQFVAAPRATVTFRGEDDDAVATFFQTGHAVELLVTRFAAGKMLAIGEVFDADQRCAADLTAAQRQLFDAAIRDVLRSRPRGYLRRGRDWLGQRSIRWRIAAAAALLAFLCLYPMTIRVAADGRIVPRTQHTVYAPVTGQIRRMACQSGMRVSAGQVLCEFSSHELDLQITRLRGESVAVQEQLQIAATRRGDDSSKDVTSDRRVLEARLEGLDSQITLLQQRQADMVVHSPIDGTVTLVTPDDVGQLQTPRPVRVGDSVIRVIDQQDGYRVELDVPDQEFGYVLAAAERQDDAPVECHFRIRSEPQRQRQGTLRGLDQAASLDRFGRLVVTASIDPNDQDATFAADAGVVGWIDCDRAAAGFVLCRKVIEQLRLWGWL